MDSFVELRVAYPGHPFVARIDGFHPTYDLDRCFEAGEYCYHRREFLGDGRQEQVYRLPLTPGIWEVSERFNGVKTRRYVLVFDGALQRITRDVVDGLLEGSISFATAVERCAALSLGPDYDKVGHFDD